MANRRTRPTRDSIVAAARGWIGTPYQHQASLKGLGADCLGLLRGVWRETVADEPEPVPPYTPGWAEFSRDETLLDLGHRHLVAQDPAAGLKPGMVLIFRFRDGVPAKHCGIATSATTFIHAHDGARVAEVPLIAAWRRRIVATFDFPRLKE